MLKTTLGAILAATALAWPGAALAAHCHKGPFNGLYIGASVGYAQLDSEQLPEGGTTLSADNGGVIAGGHLGYNVQCGHMVLGVEGDINFVDLSTRTIDAGLATFRSNVDWLASLRGRLGIAVHETALLYATAGVAWADRSHALFDPAAPGGPFSQTDSDTSVGWVIGGGIELLRHERWLFRVEALYYGLDDESRRYVVVAPCVGLCETRVRWDDDIWTVRAGLSLKLGGHEPKYEPLK